MIVLPNTADVREKGAQNWLLFISQKGEDEILDDLGLVGNQNRLSSNWLECRTRRKSSICNLTNLSATHNQYCILSTHNHIVYYNHSAMFSTKSALWKMNTTEYQPTSSVRMCWLYLTPVSHSTGVVRSNWLIKLMSGFV